mmetsp:Transcript_40832/g.60517  ORF Transcript_40832/g.60517 Transcript_40832/m.60517 type:complete len:353 (-) Transcript_40832:351-1409(-)|eukprot:CAMPEP_0194047286 /NCGR_PEP_ID=MMETSP0009_2-20130614/23812_1 /TAXON_ID=210454 /ORGANISM="Grammatophora oceanica, Strain CCMP 410" /LENGTH=352 /DNA_ID=CAMNT_0038692843 /DNA_START=298 /DNA_END=1356 /DNA_ORIENTATION=+
MATVLAEDPMLIEQHATAMEIDERQRDRIPVSYNAFETNEDGQTALHMFCSEATGTVEACRDLIQANPAAAGTKDAYGRTPLFYAIQLGCSTDIVSLLFRTQPDAINQKDFCGESPLYLIFHRTTDYQVVEAIFHLQPDLALQKVHSFAGPSLVQMVCSPWERLLHSFTAEDLKRDGPLRNQWQKVVLTVSAAHRAKFWQQHQEQPTSVAYIRKPELHEALDMRCSPKVLCWYLRMYPWQARMPLREDGRLPLSAYFTMGVPHSRSTLAVRALLEAYPDATRVLHKGQYPLHQAIDCNCPKEAIEAVLKASPAILQKSCPSTKLLPFQQSASLSQDLETIFCLLRENPTLIL